MKKNNKKIKKNIESDFYPFVSPQTWQYPKQGFFFIAVHFVKPIALVYF